MIAVRRRTLALPMALCAVTLLAGCVAPPATPTKALSDAPFTVRAVAATPFPTVALVLTPAIAPTASPTVAPAPPTMTDLLIFAPHPDDEAFCCAAAIQQALAAGKHVHVVFLTNGDGFPDAAAALSGKAAGELQPADYVNLARVRQTEAMSATRVLGLDASDLTFLGYPDAGLDRVYEAAEDAPFRQPYTQKSETYGPVVPDYHSRVHGEPAPYIGQAVLADVAELTQDLRPARIYAPNAADTHRDHQAAFRFVRDALVQLGYRGEVFTYVIHATRYPCPDGLACPPPFTVAPSGDQVTTKFKALLNYGSQVWQFFPSGPSLQAYAAEDESFWPIK